MSSSVTDAVTLITPEDATNRTYSITVTCTINPDSDADMCKVMATANGQTTHTGNEFEHITDCANYPIYMYICTCIFTYMCVVLCSRIAVLGQYFHINYVRTCHSQYYRPLFYSIYKKLKNCMVLKLFLSAKILLCTNVHLSFPLLTYLSNFTYLNILIRQVPTYCITVGVYIIKYVHTYIIN